MTYNFPSHINNNTFEGVTFTVSVNTVPLNLTDAIIKMQLRAQRPPAAVALTLSTTLGSITITDAANGVFQIDEQIISVGDPAKYLYDIQITLADGTVKTYIEGTWTILPDITR